MNKIYPFCSNLDISQRKIVPVYSTPESFPIFAMPKLKIGVALKSLTTFLVAGVL